MNRNVLALLLLLASPPLRADLDFDGTLNDYINFGNPAELQITGSFTMMAWVYWRGTLTAPAGAGRIFEKMGGAGERGIECAIDDWTTNGELAVTISDNGTNMAYRYYSVAFPRQRWVHIACVYNAPAAEVRLYMDGVRVDDTSSGTMPTSIVNTARPFCIAARCGTTALGGQFNGRITEARVYNTAVSTAVIENAAFSRSRIPITDSLVGYWPMDEGYDLQSASATVVMDRSINANNGFVHGISTYTASEWIRYP